MYDDLKSIGRDILLAFGIHGENNPADSGFSTADFSGCLPANEPSDNHTGDIMALSLEFKSLGHFFTTGFKDLAGGLKDIILFANKSQAVSPEVEALISVLAGPIGGDIADLSFVVLGEIAARLQASGASNTVTVTLDQVTIDRIKKASSVVESILTTVGGKKPNS